MCGCLQTAKLRWSGEGIDISPCHCPQIVSHPLESRDGLESGVMYLGISSCLSLAPESI